MKAFAFEVQGVQACLGGRTILHDVTLQLRAGAWTSIVGPNGAGKSTFLKVLAGLLPCTGRLDWQGRPLHNWTRSERACALSWLGQGEAAADDLCVYDVAMLGRLPHQPWLAPASAADHQAVELALRQTQAWSGANARWVPFPAGSGNACCSLVPWLFRLRCS